MLSHNKGLFPIRLSRKKLCDFCSLISLPMSLAIVKKKLLEDCTVPTDVMTTQIYIGWDMILLLVSNNMFLSFKPL